MRLARFSQWRSWGTFAASAGFCFIRMRCSGSARSLSPACSSLTRILFRFARTSFMGRRERERCLSSRRCCRIRFRLVAAMKMSGAPGRKICRRSRVLWKLWNDLLRFRFFRRKNSLPLSNRLIQLIDRLPGVHFVGPREHRLANTVSFLVEDADSISLLANLDLEGICASSGSACSAGSIEPSHVISALGYDRELANALVRFSLGRDSRVLKKLN